MSNRLVNLNRQVNSSSSSSQQQQTAGKQQQQQQQQQAGVSSSPPMIAQLPPLQQQSTMVSSYATNTNRRILPASISHSRHTVDIANLVQQPNRSRSLFSYDNTSIDSPGPTTSYISSDSRFQNDMTGWMVDKNSNSTTNSNDQLSEDPTTTSTSNNNNNNNINIESGEEDEDELDDLSPLPGSGGMTSGSVVSSSSVLLVNHPDDDNTTKRLKTFVTTTLHNERSYLLKIKKLIDFKHFLDANYSGSQTDLIVLFAGISDIYKTHDIVATKLEEYLSSINDLLSLNSSTSSKSTIMKEKFLSNALQLLANIMEISFPVYYEFLKNYPKAMTLLDKLERETTTNSTTTSTNRSGTKSFLECKQEFLGPARDSTDKSSSNQKALTDASNYTTSKEKKKEGGLLSRFKKSSSPPQPQTTSNQPSPSWSSKSAPVASSSTTPTKKTDPFNIYYNDRAGADSYVDLTRTFTEDILRRPTKLFEFIISLKDECLLAAADLPKSVCASLQSDIKSMFDNESSKKMRELVFDEINRNIMPKQVRKHEDVVELCDSSQERKLRHLILYGDCLVCCRLKKDKKQLKWYIPIDQLEIFIDEYKSAKSEIELKHLREEVASLRKRQTEEVNSAKSQLKIKKKLAEQENELTLQSSHLKLIIRANPSLSSTPLSSYPFIASNISISLPTTGLFSSTTGALASFSTSMTNLTNLNQQQQQQQPSSSSSTSGTASMTTNVPVSATTTSSIHNNHLSSSLTSASQVTNPTSSLSSFNSSTNSNHQNTNNNANNTNNITTTSYSFYTFIFLFTSDFERTAWVEEINGAIFAFKARKTTNHLTQSDIESRINSLKKIEEPPKAVTSSYTGSLELLVKHLDELQQPIKVYVAVELKSCGSYLEVAQTRCTDLSTRPIWNEKFNLELQSVDSLRIILYSQTTGKPLAIGSQELKIDPNSNLNKINCAKFGNGIILHLSMKILSPRKTITRRRTRHRNDIFGGNLADLLIRENSKIPRILKDCVEVIETRGIEEIGIYRVSSVVSEVHKIKDLYSKNPNQALAELRQKSPHLAANVLKLYLRELPDPLFTTHLYHRFMSALDCSVNEFRMVELCRVFDELPETNKTIILFVLTHLLNIASHSDKNMMTTQNLCTLFGPTLMKLSPKDNMPVVEDMGKEIRESVQQAQALFYILQLHSENKLIKGVDDDNEPDEQAKARIVDNNNNSLTQQQQTGDEERLRKASMQTAL